MCKECGCSAQGNVTQVKVSIKGLNLLNTRNTKKSILGLLGVYHVHIHAFDGHAVIDYNPSKPLGEIISLLTERGFQVSF
ncbi:MAG: hypothetical protein H6Q73_3828 [Firmicutes bacterium]|nr:hypothetical protein [Bacillota bacterium]